MTLSLAPTPNPVMYLESDYDTIRFPDGSKASLTFLNAFLNLPPGTIIEIRGKDPQGATILHQHPEGSIVLTPEQRMKSLGELLGN